MEKSTDASSKRGSAAVSLRPLLPADVELCAGWLADVANHQWLDFGGAQVLSASSLKVMAQRDMHLLRTFSPAPEAPPIGMVAFSNINRSFRSATLWYLLGDKRMAGCGCTTAAVSRLLSVGFGDLNLYSVNAWVVEGNTASTRILVRNHFCLMGRQRCCHLIGGELRDRLLFDLIKPDFHEVD